MAGRIIRYARGAALAVLLAGSARAGWIEDRGDTTVIHLALDPSVMADPTRVSAPIRAEAAVAREFVRRFPQIFAERYAARAQADPRTYGRHRWDRVEVELHKYAGIQVEGVESDLLAIAGGVAPDVLYVNFRKSDTYIQRHFLYPLDRPEDGYFSSLTDEEKAFRVHPQIWPVIDRRGPGGRHVWAVPFGGALGRVLAYRKDLFDQAGVPYPSADWSWDDLLAACRKLTRPADGVYALAFGLGKHESWYWCPFLWSAGGEVMSYHAAEDRWSIDFDSEAGVTALDFYTRLCTESWTDAAGRRRYGYAYRDPSSSFVKWERGEIAMNFQYMDEKFMSAVNPDVTGIAPVPVGPTGLRGTELNSRMMGLFSEIDERAVRDAAWEYIRFYDSREAVALKTRIMVEAGYGRFIHPKYLQMFGYEELVRLAPAGWAKTFEISLASGRPEPYGRHGNVAYDLMTFPLAEANQLSLSGALPAEGPGRRDMLRGLLAQAGAKARREMLGVVPPREVTLRRLTAGGFLIAVVVAFTLIFRRIVTSFTPPRDVLQARTSPWNLRRFGVAYLLLLPAALTILLWQYYPLLRGSLMAFQDYQILGPSRFSGLDNFGDVLWDSAWWGAVYNSLRYSFLVIALTFLPPVILAILLQEVPRARLLLRTVYYLPAVISGLVVILLWKSFYEPNERGVLNALVMRIPIVVFLALGLVLLGLCLAFARRLWFHEMRGPALVFGAAGVLLFLATVGLARPVLDLVEVPIWKRLFLTVPEPYRWLQDSRTAMISCVIPMVWAGMGPGCLIYLAALKGIADDFYEAADIDGAGFIDKIMFIVFPILRPLLVINFVGVFIGAWLHASGNILAMTGGGAGTEVADLHIFYKAFVFLEYGPATAMAWVLAFMLIGFTVYQLRILSRLEFRATGDKK